MEKPKMETSKAHPLIWWMIVIVLLLIPNFMLDMLELIRMVFSLARFAN